MQIIARKKLISVFSFVLIFLFADAQDSLVTENAEQKSFRLYSEQKWSELIKYGNSLIKDGSDYYFLRMRLAIAQYQQKNYFKAEQHFNAAIKFNSGDTLASEYLYYCYFLVGRSQEARNIAKNFSSSLLKKTRVNLKNPIALIYSEGGTKITDSSKYYNIYTRDQSIYYNHPVYFQAGLSHFIKYKINCLHTFTHYGQINFLGKLSQNQYFFQPVWLINKNLSLSTSLHWLNVRFTPHQNGLTTEQVTNSLVTALSLQKYIRNFQVGIGTTYSNLYNKNLLIHTFNSSWYLFGNSNYIIGGTVLGHTNNNYKNLYFGFSPFIYIQPSAFISLKASYFKNTQNNIIEDNGYLVNNSPDLTNYRLSTVITFNLNKHISLYGVLQRENKSESVLNFIYNYNTIIAGIKFTP